MKKNEYISFRTTSEAKKFLEEYAAKKNWSISLLVQLIVSQWIEDHKDSSNHE
ncbi:MAG: hypothetical protein IJO28_09015 [Oscillospiraceae bacterium]|nr:hypothetical protein [Oscillospiraceae bacterium]